MLRCSRFPDNYTDPATPTYEPLSYNCAEKDGELQWQWTGSSNNNSDYNGEVIMEDDQGKFSISLE